MSSPFKDAELFPYLPCGAYHGTMIAVKNSPITFDIRRDSGTRQVTAKVGIDNNTVEFLLSDVGAYRIIERLVEVFGKAILPTD